MAKLEYKRLPVWRAIFFDAWGKTFKDLGFLGFWGVIIAVILFAIYALLVFQTGGVDAFENELLDKFFTTLAPVLAILLVYPVRVSQTIADREIELGKRILKLRTRLMPHFEIGVVRQAFTNTSNQASEFICITVRNVSDAQSDQCDAHLTELRSDTGLAIVDSVELRWMGTNGDQTWAEIPSGATKTVKVFRIHDDGLAFNMSVIPEPYRGVLAGATKMTGKIVLHDPKWGGQHVYFIAYAGTDKRLEIIQTEAFEEPGNDPEDEA